MSGLHRDRIPLLVLHDFNKSGFSIIGTLRRSNRRYTFANEIEVVDLGLRLPDFRVVCSRLGCGERGVRSRCEVLTSVTSSDA